MHKHTRRESFLTRVSSRSFLSEALKRRHVWSGVCVCIIRNVWAINLQPLKYTIIIIIENPLRPQAPDNNSVWVLLQYFPHPWRDQRQHSHNKTHFGQEHFDTISANYCHIVTPRIKTLSEEEKGKKRKRKKETSNIGFILFDLWWSTSLHSHLIIINSRASSLDSQSSLAGFQASCLKNDLQQTLNVLVSPLYSKTEWWLGF